MDGGSSYLLSSEIFLDACIACCMSNVKTKIKKMLIFVNFISRDTATAYILKRGTCWNHLEKAETNWKELEPPWNKVELPGITWNKMELSVKRWIQQRTDTKNKKFIGRECACKTMAQQNTILGTVVVTKSTISDVCRRDNLERKGTSNKLTQIKTLLGQ